MAKMTPHEFLVGLSEIDSDLARWQVKLAHTTIDELEDQWRSTLKLGSVDGPQEGALEEWVESTDMSDVPQHTVPTAAGKASEQAAAAKGGPPKGELPKTASLTSYKQNTMAGTLVNSNRDPRQGASNFLAGELRDRMLSAKAEASHTTKEAELVEHIKMATNPNSGDATLVNMGSSPKKTSDSLQFGSNVGEKVQRDNDVTKKLFGANSPTMNAERLSEGSSNSYKVEGESNTEQGEKEAGWRETGGALTGAAIGGVTHGPVGAVIGGVTGVKAGKAGSRRARIRQEARAKALKALEAEKPAIARRVKKELAAKNAEKSKMQKVSIDASTLAGYAKATGIGALGGAALGAGAGALSTPNYGDKELTKKERLRRALIGAGVGAGVGGAAGAGLKGAKHLKGARIGKLTGLGSGEAMTREHAMQGMRDAARATKQSVAGRRESWKGLSGLSRRIGSTSGKGVGAQAYRVAQQKGREIAAKVPQHIDKARHQLGIGRNTGVRVAHGVPTHIQKAQQVARGKNIKALDMAEALTRRHPELMSP